MVTLADPKIFASKHKLDEQPEEQPRTFEYHGTKENHQDEQPVYH